MASLSSAKVEYYAFHRTITKLFQLKILLSQLNFGPKELMVLFCDNNSAIEIANNLVQCDRIKHIELYQN